jgi:hypothetical protein
MKNDANMNLKANNYCKFDQPYNGETEVLHYLEMLKNVVGFDKGSTNKSISVDCRNRLYDVNLRKKSDSDNLVNAVRTKWINSLKDIGYYNGSYSEIEVSKQNEWTAETIKERGLSMLQFMEERWKFKFKDWEIDKEEILFPSK